MSLTACEMPGTGGTFAVVATLRALILSPSALSARGDGPTHPAPASITRVANDATSERQP